MCLTFLNKLHLYMKKIKEILKFLLMIPILIFSLQNLVAAEVVKKIIIDGNERVSDETIKMFSAISIDDNFNDFNINELLKDLYDTNFFENINIKFDNNTLSILVKEYPIIENIYYEGLKTSKIENIIKENIRLKPRSSFNISLLENDKKSTLLLLKDMGYYFSKIDIFVEKVSNNKVNLTYKVNIGKKAKVKKITFLGNKIYKDSKLRGIITSEEYKFWKIISGKKFLNKNLVNLDTRLLKNFYLNNGYYNVQINSSFAKLINKDEFEIIFNINPENKIYFRNFNLDIPSDFDQDNFNNLKVIFEELKGKPYSFLAIDKILEEINKITSEEQYQSTKASVIESTESDKIDLNFKIQETEKFYVEKINIFGNNITRENVIRNQLEIDEGDPFNEILEKKSLNNIKSLNFFSSVESKIVDGVNGNKSINITVDEKPTGEISASAGVGTTGSSIGFGIKENNFLGAGISLDSKLILGTSSINGILSILNPNYKDTNKSVYLNIEASEEDNYETFGYKTNKTGFGIGTNFELYDDTYFGFGNSNFYEKIETDSTASARQKKQEGDYWDSFLNLDFDFDKRNQKYQTTSGFRSYYSLDLPIISDTNTLKNRYNYKYFSELYENNISSFSLFLESANSLSNKDVKLSERVNIPSNRLRGFEAGRVGPKDGEDFIGGNYVYALNFATTLPQILENSQSADFMFFIDAANIWGVDYDSSLNNSNNIRSSIGIALDWYTPIGPLNFSFAHPILKEKTDKTETFRFNLGTTF